jgi:Recombinase
VYRNEQHRLFDTGQHSRKRTGVFPFTVQPDPAFSSQISRMPHCGTGVHVVPGLLRPSYLFHFKEVAMAYFERMRDQVAGVFSPEIMQQRAAAGWQMVSIEWRRELPDSEAPSEMATAEEIPYGLRISDDCKRLEVDPAENRVLLLMMDLLAQDFSYSSIVSDLNEKGYRTRQGKPWSRIAVFNMMPRLIEVGPRIFSSEEWEQRRAKLGKRQPVD